MNYFKITVVALLICGEAFAMHTSSNDCGTLKKEPYRGVIAYTRTAELGRRIFVQRQEKDGIECFAGYETDIFGNGPVINFSDREHAKKLWYKLHKDHNELYQINN